MKPRVKLKERSLTYGHADITLSNYNIQQLKQLTDGSFNNHTAEQAVHKLIEQQIKPFLHETGRKATEDNIAVELEEAFNTHIYSLTDPD